MNSSNYNLISENHKENNKKKKSPVPFQKFIFNNIHRATRTCFDIGGFFWYKAEHNYRFQMITKK